MLITQFQINQSIVNIFFVQIIFNQLQKKFKKIIIFFFKFPFNYCFLSWLNVDDDDDDDDAAAPVDAFIILSVWLLFKLAFFK